MTNKKLRDRGELYDANYDPELVRLMDECKDKCWEYNQIKPSDWTAKDAKLREIIGSVGSGARVQAPFWCDYGTNITFGENFYANHGLVILDGAKVVFGKNVFVAPNCGFHTAGHPLDAERRNKGLEYAKPITIGDNVYISDTATSSYDGLAQAHDIAFTTSMTSSSKTLPSTGAYSGAGWYAVQEPTSDLLVLLGMAGLALRRKRA